MSTPVPAGVGSAAVEPAAGGPGVAQPAAGPVAGGSAAVASPGLPQAVLLARAYLSRVAEAPSPALVRLVATVGPVQAAERVRRGAVSEEVARETRARRAVDRAHADLAAGTACGARLLTPEHAEWPAWALAAFDLAGEDAAVPLALWVRGPGSLADLTDRAVAIVGARAATGYGLHVAADLAAGAVERGFTVVSGAALGIDGAAHRGALAAGGPTVAVLACGIDRAYPSAHEGLLGRIAATGLVVSEYPPGAVPARHRFLVRNRLIAGLASGTVVVEAGLRSGARRTASDARGLGRVVMAVPGPVTSGRSDGCHLLIQQGAQLVTRAEEVVEAAGRIGDDLADVPGPEVERPTDGLEPIAARVHDALPSRGARDVGWLALEAAVPVEAVRVALVELERRGMAQHVDGRWRRATPPGS